MLHPLEILAYLVVVILVITFILAVIFILGRAWYGGR